MRLNKKNVYYTTLGCSKNDVDTASMRTILENKNYNTVFNPEAADVIVVNTCGFIEDAKKESIEEIFNMAEYTKGENKKLVVSGCLAQRYADELMEEIPDIDCILGTGQIAHIDSYIENLNSNVRQKSIDDINSEYVEGLYKTNVTPVEYVKISEGCNNFCSYCIIPALRGKNRSRSIENILDEVKYLVAQGTKEIVLIAQNTTDYGIDLYGEYSLPKLLKELEMIENLKWVRLLYLYPDNFTDELIEVFKNSKKILKYADIPLQHVNDGVLKGMNRRTSKADIVHLISKLRKEIPEMIIRTTFIVGFPGEADSDFEQLCTFVKDMKLDKVGVFEFSREENTKAYSMENQVDAKTKSVRKRRLMEIQEEVSARKISEKIKKNFECIIEEINEETIVARSYMDAPEIDGVVYVNGDYLDVYKVGDFIDVLITDTMEYDMIGELYESSK